MKTALREPCLIAHEINDYRIEDPCANIHRAVLAVLITGALGPSAVAVAALAGHLPSMLHYAIFGALFPPMATVLLRTAHRPIIRPLARHVWRQQILCLAFVTFQGVPTTLGAATAAYALIPVKPNITNTTEGSSWR